jgi:hypothetical protein
MSLEGYAGRRVDAWVARVSHGQKEDVRGLLPESLRSAVPASAATATS